ncbi:MAG TPA: rod shape-determining protein MreC [Nevskiaceae bacterium]|nr:rod shape-determining protein MreC [Nevskiaceae bacterium]
MIFSCHSHYFYTTLNTVVISSHRRYFPRGPGLGLKALTLILCSLALIFADNRGDSLKPTREWATWALQPVIWLVSFPSQAATAPQGLQTRAALEAENKELRDKQLVLEAQLTKFQALEAENRRIRELLSSAKNLSERVLIAEIVAINQDPYRHQITLNKGTRDGVYRGQALVDATGVMGQIVEVGPGTSQALLITDPDHGIPVEINRTGLQTIALGRGDGRGLTLPFLPSNADVKEGDLLVSSSLGGRFPSGYPVGQIYEVKHTAGEHFMAAAAYPSAHLNQGRQALLVWSNDADAAAAAEAAAAAAAAEEARAARSNSATTATHKKKS